jgi:polysaccharide biosynthesis protein PslH
MKSLIVSPFSPYPLVFGGAIRLYHLVKMFAAFSETTLLSYASWTDDPNVADHLQTICSKVVLVDGKPQANGRLRARSLLSARSFQYHSHYTAHFQQAIDRVLQEQRYDIIVVEQTQMAYFNYGQSGALQILDLQNIEHELLLRRAAVEKGLPKRAGLWVEGQKFRAEELKLCRGFDLIFTPSDRERDALRTFQGMPPVMSLPNSIDPDFFAHRWQAPAANEIAFIGTTHVDANRDGLIYFMDEIFPLIERLVPDITLSIVGGSPPPEIKAYGQRPNVEVTGYVKDVRDYMARAKALVVPLRSGGGTRLKILEGLSYGVPTISTSVGAEGLGLVDGEQILLGDTPQRFAEQVARALGDTALQQRLRAAGRQVAEERYSWQAVGRQLQRHLEPALAARQAAQQPGRLALTRD